MKKKISDFGGHASTRRRSMPADYSHRCRDCDTIRYTAAKEWLRSAVPRCLQCGGPLLETAATEVRERGTAAQRKLRDETSKREKVPAPPPSCRACRMVLLDTPEDLAKHLKASRTCAQDYAVSLRTVGEWIAGTGYIVQKELNLYYLFAIRAATGTVGFVCSAINLPALTAHYNSINKITPSEATHAEVLTDGK